MIRDFVTLKLFPICTASSRSGQRANTIEYKIGEIFGEIKTRSRAATTCARSSTIIDELRFRSQTEKHELRISTKPRSKHGQRRAQRRRILHPAPAHPRHDQVVPKIGERIYDGACGSAGFLCEAFDLPARKAKALGDEGSQDAAGKTFYGKEKKSLAYVIAIMNMILHGIEAPNIIHTNTLTKKLADIQEKDRFDVVLANPPFGGKERRKCSKLPHPHRRNRVSFPPALHQDAQGRRPRRGGHQEHLLSTPTMPR